MSAGPRNNFQLPFGNVLLCHRTFHYATSRQIGQTRERNRTYTNPDKYDDDTNGTNERRFSY